jgi:tetratricopeptide (TPR) repeat protein
VLGLVNFDFQEKSTVAERFMYLPMLGVAMVVGALLARFPNSTRSMLALSMVLILAMVVRSGLQVGFWRDSQTLLQHAVRMNPDSFAARTNLAITRLDAGDYSSAIEHALAAVELKPTFCGSHLALAEALSLSGRPTDAEQVLQAALSRKWDRATDVADLRASLAAVWMLMGRNDDARELAGQILKNFPNHPQARNLVDRLRNEPTTRPGRMP